MADLSIYTYLEKQCQQSNALIVKALLGLTWSYCRIQNNNTASTGFAQSSGGHCRTLTWPGTLVGKKVSALSSWLHSWNSFEATLGMALTNAVINNANNALMEMSTPIAKGEIPNLSVFEYFKPQLAGKKVVVIGRYPGMDRCFEGIDVCVLERNPSEDDLPDPAAAYVLPEADWVFITGTTLMNKTFPHIAELSRAATTVLMGPTVPWTSYFNRYNINYLAGIKVTSCQKAEQIAEEGGGTRLFDEGVQYAVIPL